MALEIVIIHILAGAALGWRFRVMILVPALTLTMLFAAIVGVARGDQFWSIAVAMILLGTAIQIDRIGSSAVNGGHNVEIGYVTVSGERDSRTYAVLPTVSSFIVVWLQPLQIRLV